MENLRTSGDTSSEGNAKSVGDRDAHAAGSHPVGPGMRSFAVGRMTAFHSRGGRTCMA